MKVVCIDNNFPRVSCNNHVPLSAFKFHPVKGEIYKVDDIITYPNSSIGYLLADFEGRAYGAKFFRPVDDTFGEWVEQTILKDAEYEHVTKQMEMP